MHLLMVLRFLKVFFLSLNNMKLHLGCGKRYLEGYIHIDIADFEHIDHKIPVHNLSIFEDGSISEIYASHVIEYFDRDEVLNLLAEWKRVLKDGGLLRIAVPNFQELINVYKMSGNLDSIIGPLYGKWEIGESNSIYHKTVYDFKSLSNTLSNVGFKNINKWDWRTVFNENLEFDDHSQAYFPHMDKNNGIHVSLNIECRK